ncbi:LAME_0F19086g1_1 [Lachancea meyersii CBS 8951]|uniref:LAME_0F19086g1_1 n=1 Tax=Lachancea meyersii CBS 8951 TaxID=1266667 RepID=A0A1G4K1B7_9SACH|nr:LAME_0F19086g1_1 [Lachancea meyersii CBS 8951]
MQTQQILSQLEQNLFLPSGLLSCEKTTGEPPFKCTLAYGIVADASMLDCGCIVSEKLLEELQNHLEDKNPKFCPVCLSCSSTMVGPVKPLRMLHDQLQFFKQDEERRSPSELHFRKLPSPSSPKFQASQDEPSQTDFYNKDQQHVPKQSLISLFHSVASSLDNPDEEEAIEVHSLDNASNTKTVPIQDSGSVPVSLATTESPSSVQISELDEEKEFYFAKCFPMYRKRSQFNTHNKFLRTKSKQFVNTAISPNCTKFALITEQKWEVYSISQQPKKDDHESKKDRDLRKILSRSRTSQLKDDGPGSPESVSLLFCGKFTGEYGTSFETLQWPSDLSCLYTPKQLEGSRTVPKIPPAETWEHLYCQMSEDLLIISGTKGRFRVFDMNCDGKPIYTYGSTFPIRCIDIDAKSSLIACGITGNDRSTGAEHALILFHQVEKDTKSSAADDICDVRYKFSSPITTTLPYRDPINTLQFSPDSNYISCSTALESRFLVISLRKVHEPRLVMKSLRSIDTSLESEGITDTKMFPGNSSLMCVTSVAFNAPPIVINTRIQTINVAQSVAQPAMLLRLDELGSKIHKCEISPRNDSIAFLDRNGNVFIMYAPTLLDNEKRRIVLVDAVANASRVREAASLKFSADGHKLYILDRKGSLYVEDFANGLPQDQDVTKCKQIN